MDETALEKAVRDLLVALGEDPTRDGLVDTPGRVARAYAEMLAGQGEDPVDHLRTCFESVGGDYVIQRNIRFNSMCEHHLLPFTGKAHIAYVPNGRVVTGLSKLARVVDGYARRLQLQERLTDQIADALQRGLDAKGVLVVTEANHGCMSTRGVHKPDASTLSVATRGCLADDRALRLEIMRLMDLPQAPEPAARSLVMGILNVTPDSFSDGGQYFGVEEALAHAHAMVAAGADIIDIGGESTRPGAMPVTAQQEQERILPVIKRLSAAGYTISVDTYRAETARLAVAAGAQIVNDVSGGLGDPQMHAMVAQLGVDYVLQHWRGTPDTMNSLANYTDCAVQVCAELRKQRDAALAAGVDGDKIILDPGLGFAKQTEHNWELIAYLDVLQAMGHRVLIGASRKRFVAALVDEIGGDSTSMSQRDEISALIAAVAADRGVWAIRVHNVAATHRAVAVANKVREVTR